jgi:hypothetical protein
VLGYVVNGNIGQSPADCERNECQKLQPLNTAATRHRSQAFHGGIEEGKTPSRMLLLLIA